jgi:small nuclear ribonucleoprotein (snRNP)-like protein
MYQTISPLHTSLNERGGNISLEELLSTCQRYLKQRVFVTTLDGRVHEGILVNFDNDNLYLDTSAAFISNKASKASVKAFGFGFGGGIFALALFDILAISLFAGRGFW